MMIDIAPEIEAPPKETVTFIPPSEAIRLGRLSFPYVISREWSDHKGGACTYSAMIVGYGGLMETEEALLNLPRYVRSKLREIPTILDFGFPTMTRREVEKLLIRSLKAMGY